MGRSFLDRPGCHRTMKAIDVQPATAGTPASAIPRTMRTTVLTPPCKRGPKAGGAGSLLTQCDTERDLGAGSRPHSIYPRTMRTTVLTPPSKRGAKVRGADDSF